MSKKPEISVVIPVWNGASSVGACIAGILSQTIQPLEVIVIDSGSTDGSAGLVRQFDRVRLIEITPEEFNHGGTRNLGAAEARGSFVLMTVQDARPASVTWIEQLLLGMTDDEVAGVCGTQVVPHDRDKNPVAWFRPQSTPHISRVQFFDSKHFTALTPAEKKRAVGWDNVTAIYRRSCLLEIPFRQTQFAEDILWARDALLAGYALVYNPAARVYHYHDETEDFAFRRALASLYYRYIATGDVPSPSSFPAAMSRAAKCLLQEESISWSERVFWFRYNWRNNLAVRRAIREFQRAARGSHQDVENLRQHYLRGPIASVKTSPSGPA